MARAALQAGPLPSGRTQRAGGQRGAGPGGGAGAGGGLGRAETPGTDTLRPVTGELGSRWTSETEASRCPRGTRSRHQALSEACRAGRHGAGRPGMASGDGVRSALGPWASLSTSLTKGTLARPPRPRPRPARQCQAQGRWPRGQHRGPAALTASARGQGWPAFSSTKRRPSLLGLQPRPSDAPPQGRVGRQAHLAPDTGRGREKGPRKRPGVSGEPQPGPHQRGAAPKTRGRASSRASLAQHLCRRGPALPPQEKDHPRHHRTHRHYTHTPPPPPHTSPLHTHTPATTAHIATTYTTTDKATSEHAHTTAQLHSSHTLGKSCSKFSKPGFSNT